MLESCKTSLKTHQTRCFARKHKTQLGYIVVNKASRLVHFCQEFHFLETKTWAQNDKLSSSRLKFNIFINFHFYYFINFTSKKRKKKKHVITHFTNNLHCILNFLSMSSNESFFLLHKYNKELNRYHKQVYITIEALSHKFSYMGWTKPAQTSLLFK